MKLTPDGPGDSLRIEAKQPALHLKELYFVELPNSETASGSQVWARITDG
jgi:hypothetical protein